MAELFNSLPAAPELRTFVKYLTAFCSRLVAASDVKADGCDIFSRFSNFSKCRPEVECDVMSCAAVVYGGVDGCVQNLGILG